MTFRSSLLSALVNIRNLVPSFSIILPQPLVHWRSKKSEKSHKLLSELSGMVTQFNKISSPVSLFFLQGKIPFHVFFIESKNTEHSQLLKIPIIFWQLFYVLWLLFTNSERLPAFFFVLLLKDKLWLFWKHYSKFALGIVSSSNQNGGEN